MVKRSAQCPVPSARWVGLGTGHRAPGTFLAAMTVMADEKNEPQSYGSSGEWVRGDVGEEVNRLEGNPNSQHSDFYESRRESEENGPDQGGHVSPEQVADNREQSGRALEEGEPVQKITAQESGAKRDSWFKKRDYD